MSSIVLELQQEVLKPECDILNALRKAHLIASKLKLQEFDAWIMYELDGYPDAADRRLPEYRKVAGALKAWNPRLGWIPVMIGNREVEAQICTADMDQPISEIVELYKSCKTYIRLTYSGAAIDFLNKSCNTPILTNYELHVGAHHLKTIIDKVANCLLEWTIRLESEGVLGEGMRFSQEETVMAQNVPQTINNYYGTVVNGEVKQSQVISGDQNTISFNYGHANDLLQKVKKAIRDELPSGEDRETADELIAEVETKLAAQVKPGIIKAALTGLKEFLISSGANVAGALLVDYLQQVF